MQSFNPEQQEIVDHIQGALLVLAPAGTGKTRVLTERVANAISQGIPAEKILCVTFTNRAAKEMQERLQQTYPDNYRKLTIKTFHGLCTQILRLEGKTIGLPSDFTIYDEVDCWELIKVVSGLNDQDKEQKKRLNDLNQAIQNAKSETCKVDLSLSFPAKLGLKSWKGSIALDYQSSLQEQHALDFSDLVYYTRSMLHCHPEIGERWSNRYELIQVDEVQDTHLAEYEVIHHLAKISGNIALIGDLDQTIYEWRGSQPEKLVEAFENNFSPTTYNLTYNYRATKTLINAASGFAESFAKRHTICTADTNADEGEAIGLHNGDSVDNEGEWIAKQIKALASSNKDFQYNRVAVLTRTNPRASCVANKLQQLNIPCITADQYDLLRKPECKNTLAYLSFLVNPFDSSAFRRILNAPPKGVDKAVIDIIVKQGQAFGLKLTDFTSINTLNTGEPFKDLLTAYKDSKIIVFDTETTGLSAAKDEVIELGAVKLYRGKQIARFHCYLKNTVPIGDSELVHKISQSHLDEHGISANEAFQEFKEFIGDSLLVGHNVKFDIKMLHAHASRLGIKFENNLWADTWDISTRFIESENHKLETLSRRLNLPSRQAHSAIEDALTASDLLLVLIPLIQVGISHREKFIDKYKSQFCGIALMLDRWRHLEPNKRPHEILTVIVNESQLNRYHSTCIENLKKLRAFMKERDDTSLPPQTSLHSILELIALTKNVDLIAENDNLTPIITIHQSKGMEFDTVFLAGAVDSEFPSFYSLRPDGNIEEEKRSFYVAMTRAKQRLFITGHTEDEKGYSKIESRFIKSIPKEYLHYLLE